MLRQPNMTLKELEGRHAKSSDRELTFGQFVSKYFPKHLHLLGGSTEGRARKRETVASGIETARPKIDASSEPRRPIGKIYAAEQHEQTPTDGLRSPLKSIGEKSPAKITPQQKWRKKNKKKLAAYQKKWRARNK